MTEKEKRKQVAKISVFITSIFVIFLSISYAFINQTLAGTKRQVITAGNLELELKEGNAITLENALPMYDEVGMIGESFDFTLSNPSTVDMTYQIKLIDETVGEKLDLNIVKYGLTKENKNTIQTLSSLENNILEEGKIASNEIIHYSLRLWIDFNVEDETEIVGKSLSYKLTVASTQKAQYASIRKRTSGTSKDYFWKYDASITTIVLENKINVASTAVESWEMGENIPNSIMAYIEEDGSLSDGTPAYKLHIQGDGGISANKNSGSFFRNFPNLTAIEGLKYFDTSNTTNMLWMFGGDTSLTSLDLSGFDTSKVVNMASMFNGCISLNTLNLNGLDTPKLKEVSSMFYNCVSLISLDLSSFTTTNITNVTQMFAGCSSLKTLDISNFDTSNMTNMSALFRGCESLTTLDLRHFDTSNVTKMSQMFSGCTSLINLNIKNFNTSKVAEMNGMFTSCESLVDLDINHFDTAKVTDMSSMFSNCDNLVNINMSNWNTSSVTNMSNMFAYCNSLETLMLENFNTANVLNMSQMFINNKSLKTLDISHFDISKVANSAHQFTGVSPDCSVLVENETMKNWVLEQNKNLTNVTIKEA